MTDGALPSGQLLQAFRAAAYAQAERAVDGAAALVPDQLAEACRRSLQVDAASISVIGEIRVPLGASDDDAAFAERLQFTHGEGPCLDAVRAGRAVRASSAQIESRWPLLFAELVRHTRFRSVASFPLTLSENVYGALDVHFVDSDAASRVSLPALAVVAHEIGRALSMARRDTDVAEGTDRPVWLGSPAARHRQQVWIAIGMTSQWLALNAGDALALLRAHAFAGSRSVDELASSLVHGELDVRELRP